MKDYSKRLDKVESKKAQVWEPFDWTNETYLLMCRQYRDSLGLVDSTAQPGHFYATYESKYETESEHKAWADIYRARGYGPYEGKRHYRGGEITVQVIPDPPQDFVDSWVKSNGYELRSLSPEPNEQY